MFKKTLVATLIAGLFGSSAATADVQTEMQSWFNGMGGYGNITGTQVVNGQTSTTYTGGNMFVRMPTKNYQISAFAPPSINAGCGGIDLFAGSFSFINSAQLTALLRNIGNNAVNYAFMLAIKSASGEMADLLQYLQDQASKLNNLNVNSCHAAEGIVNAIAPAQLTEKAAQAGAQGTGATLSNLEPDSFQSFTDWESSNTAKKQMAAAEAAADPNAAAMVNPGNIVYSALVRSNVPPDLYPLMMGLTGAIIIEPVGQGDNTGGSAKWNYVPPTVISFKDFIGDPGTQTTTSLMGLKCDSTISSPPCMNPTAQSINVESLAYDVNKTINDGTVNILNRSPQNLGSNPTDMILYANTTLPLYKLARIAAMNNNVALATSYSQVIAIDLAYKWMISVLQSVQQIAATSANTAQTPDVVKASEELRKQIGEQLKIATAEYQAEYAKVIANTNLQQNLKKINDEMVDAFNPSIQNSINKFSR